MVKSIKGRSCSKNCGGNILFDIGDVGYKLLQKGLKKSREAIDEYTPKLKKTLKEQLFLHPVYNQERYKKTKGSGLARLRAALASVISTKHARRSGGPRLNATLAYHADSIAKSLIKHAPKSALNKINRELSGGSQKFRDILRTVGFALLNPYTLIGHFSGKAYQRNRSKEDDDEMYNSVMKDLADDTKSKTTTTSTPNTTNYSGIPNMF